MNNDNSPNILNHMNSGDLGNFEINENLYFLIKSS